MLESKVTGGNLLGVGEPGRRFREGMGMGRTVVGIEGGAVAVLVFFLGGRGCLGHRGCVGVVGSRVRRRRRRRWVRGRWRELGLVVGGSSERLGARHCCSVCVDSSIFRNRSLSDHRGLSPRWGLLAVEEFMVGVHRNSLAVRRSFHESYAFYPRRYTFPRVA